MQAGSTIQHIVALLCDCPDKATTAAAGRGVAIHLNTSVVGGYSAIGITNRQPE